MCGRYASTRSSADLAGLFDAVDDTDGAWSAGWNVAPTDRVPVVRRSRSADARVIDMARWGLVPPWSKDPSSGARMINARSETVATSRVYRVPFSRKRCLVPADGWYEWRRLPGGGKQPYFMTPADGTVLTFAGLWESWGRGEERLLTFSVLTTEAVGRFERVHDRMPLIVPAERRAGWLGEEEPVVDLLTPPASSLLAELDIRPVSRAVGNVNNDGPALVEPVPEPEERAAGTDRITLF